MKKILMIVGSGVQNGNTDQLADAFMKGASEAGHEVTKVFLGNKRIEGCLGCNACRFGKPCVLRDDMQDIYPLFERADMIVLASPLYYWTLSARTKAFLERLYAKAEEDPNPLLGRYEKYPHKESVLLMTAADNLFWTFEQAVAYYRFNCIRYLGWTDRGMLLAGGCGGASTKRRIAETGKLEEAHAFAKSL